MSIVKVIHGTVLHDGKKYGDRKAIPELVRDRAYGGDTIEFDESDEDQAEQLALLLRAKVVARPEDLVTLQNVQDLAAENEALKQHQADLEQQLREALARVDAEKSIQ